MRGTLVSIDAWNRSTRARVTVRVGSARNSTTLGADGFVWEPTLSRRPRLSMQLADDDLSGEVMAGVGELTLNAAALRYVQNPMALDWIGSTIRIYSGDGDQLADMRREFIGLVTDGVTDADTGLASLSIEVQRALVDVPLIVATYTGGGGIEGEVELRGNTKPAGFGRPINVRPILINTALSIYQFDAFGNTLGVNGVYEDLASFGASSGNYASYAALAAAPLKEGQWATCFAQGLLRLGADASGTITCDPVFGADRPGSMMLRWLRTHAGVPEALIRVSDFDALTAAVQAVCGSAPAVSFWTSEPGNVLTLMQRMCASCNAVPLLLLDGTIGISRYFGGREVITLDRQGGSPAVVGWMSSSPPTPWWRLRMTAARSYYVNPPSEIDYEDEIRDMGDYVSTETYRQGMVVRGADGARYIYKASTPSAGTAPPDGDVKWELYESAPDASTIRYSSGKTLQSLEPMESGANATEGRTANAITGQGGYATVSQVTKENASTLLGDGIIRSPTLANNAVQLGTNIVRADTTTKVTDATAITSLGTASAISGQGAFATISSLAYGSSLLTGFAALAAQAKILLGGGFIFRNDGSTALTDALAITSLGTAAAFVGQGAFATISSITAANASTLINSFSLFASRLNIGDTANMTIDSGMVDPQSWTGTAFTLTPLAQTSASTNYLRIMPAAAAPQEVRGAPMPVEAGKDYFVSIKPFTSGNNNAQADAAIEWFRNADGTGSIEVVLIGSTLMSALAARTATITAPANARAARWLFKRTAAGTDASEARFAEPVFRRSVDGSLASSNAFRLGFHLTRSDGSTTLTDALAVTSLGTASAITGQGALATRSAADWATQLSGAPPFVTDPYTAGDGTKYLQAGYVYLGNNQPERNLFSYFPATPGSDKTGNATASAIAGQGAFATISSADLNNASLFRPTGRFASYLNDTRYFSTDNMIYPVGPTTVSDLRPQELGSNVTEKRASSAITGQGALATKNAADWGTQLSGAPAYVTDPYTAGDGKKYLQAGYVYLGNNQPERNLFSYFPATPGSDKTGNATASAIAGQGAFATATTISRANIFSGSYFTQNAFSLDYSITRADGTTTVTESIAITALGTASAIVNQGSFATKNVAGVSDLGSGTGGVASILSDENAVTFSSNNGWVDMATISLKPPFGQPIKGTFSCVLTDLSGTSTSVQVRVIRDDGTAIKYGSGGLKVAVRDEGESLSFVFVDQVAKDRETTWKVQFLKPSGTHTVSCAGRFLEVEERPKVAYQNVSITAASGTGPGAGGGGGGFGGGGGGAVVP